MKKYRKWTDEAVAKAVRLRLAGMSMQAVAAELGYRHSASVSMKLRSKHPIVQAHAAALQRVAQVPAAPRVWTDDRVENIVRMRLAGRTLNEIAAEAGAGSKSICRILNSSHPTVRRHANALRQVRTDCYRSGAAKRREGTGKLDKESVLQVYRWLAAGKSLRETARQVGAEFGVRISHQAVDQIKRGVAYPCWYGNYLAMTEGEP